MNSKKHSVWDIAYEKTGDYICKERNKFLNKIGQFYCNIEALEELDDGTIDFKVYN